MFIKAFTAAAALFTLLAVLSIYFIPRYIIASPLEATLYSGSVRGANIDKSQTYCPRRLPRPSRRPEPVITEIVMSFVGDCMLATDRGGEYDGSFNALANEVDPSYFLENFIELFESDDWTVVNLENVFSDDPNVYPRNKGYTPAYWYKSKTANTAILTRAASRSCRLPTTTRRTTHQGL